MVEVLIEIDCFLQALLVDLLLEITMSIKQADRDEVEIEIAGRFAMVARQNAQTAGIIWDRFVKAKLGRKIGDRIFDRTACARFSIGVFASKIIAECVMNLLQLAQESFVLRDFFEARLARELEHAHGIVIRPVPKLGVEMPEKAARGRLPCPPKIEAHLAQRLERSRQSRSHVISLKGRHGRGAEEIERELIRKSSWGKYCLEGRCRSSFVHNVGQLCRYCTMRAGCLNGIFFGAMASPAKKPVINPHRCAAMLTCGVERSNAT